jgi:uncharacterized phage protein (predicted DNA packaging)
MAMVDDVKLALRVSDNVLDAEITDIIAAARKDLKSIGILATKADADNDALIKRAIVAYTKAHFGYDDDAQRFLETYTMIKSNLSMQIEYTVSV